MRGARGGAGTRRQGGAWRRGGGGVGGTLERKERPGGGEGRGQGRGRGWGRERGTRLRPGLKAGRGDSGRWVGLEAGWGVAWQAGRWGRSRGWRSDSKYQTLEDGVEAGIVLESRETAAAPCPLPMPGLAGPRRCFLWGRPGLTACAAG